jgi:hypothetical protein
MKDSELKLCKDCEYGPKHFEFSLGCGHTAFCTHPDAPVDPVFGNKDASHALMRSANCTIPNCGPEGRWFTEAQPLKLQFVKASDYAGTYGGTVETDRDRSMWERAKHWFI